MKLLLTSAGISNETIAKAFFAMVGKKPEEIFLAFIPTASNIEKGNKVWLIDDLVNLRNLGIGSISIVDISAVGRDIWEPQLQEADVLYVEGGNTFHLMEWVRASHLNELLPDLLATKVYVGVSAGSMIMSPDLILNVSQGLHKKDLERTENMQGLGLIDGYVLPHFNSPHFSIRNKENVLQAVAHLDSKIYALDDDSALELIDRKVRIISEGDFLEIN